MRLLPLLLVSLCAIVNAVPQAAPPPAATSSSVAAAPSSGAPPAATPAPSAAPSAVSSGAVQPPASGSVIPSMGGGNQTLPSGAVNGTQPSGNGQNDTLAGLPTSASFGNSIYPGTATFLTPTASKSVSPLYRIDARENVTFVWQFSDLKVQPANLTLAAVGPNKITYTITALPGAATSAVWQVKDVPSASPLMMGMYQIQLYDQRGVSAIPQPGWLAPVTRLSIAFYSPEAYQPSSGPDYCPTCFYNAGKRMAENFGPIAIAFGVASATSAMILYGLLY